MAVPKVILRSVDLTARAEVDAVALTLVAEVDILSGSSQYQECFLLPDTVAVEECQGTKVGSDMDDVVFGEPQSGGDGGEVVVKNGIRFIGRGPARYTVRVRGLVPYLTSLGQGFGLQLPTASRTTLTVVVPGTEETHIMVQPALLTQHHAEGESTIARCVLPPVSSVSVKWTQKIAAVAGPGGDGPDESARARSVTVVQDILHSIGGGVVFTSVKLKYNLRNTSMSVFEVVVDSTHGSTLGDSASKLADSPRFRVLTVEGAHLRKWEIVDTPDSPRGSVLRLTTEGAIEGPCEFMVEGELEMVNTTCSVYLPTFSCREVDRMKGYVAVLARTAVEVMELTTRYIAKVDVKELPKDLQAGNVLLGYHFITGGYTLNVRVVKHTDVGVLVAAVEQATFEVTHTGTHIFYDCNFKIKNTQCQFARLSLPHPSCVIWSATVQDEPVKPTINRDSQVLLPMLMSREDAFHITIILVMGGQQLHAGEGVQPLRIPLPSVDMPINQLYCCVHAPHAYRYDEWQGLTEVDGWSSYPQRYERYHSSGMQSVNLYYQAPQMQKMANRANKRQRGQRSRRSPRFHTRNRGGNMNRGLWGRGEAADLEPQVDFAMDFDIDSDSGGSLDSMSDGEDDMDFAGGGRQEGMAAGIKALKLSVGGLKVGEAFWFERLLLPASESLSLETQCRAVAHQRPRPPLEGRCTIA